MTWLLFTVPLAILIALVCADHIPGLRTLVDGGTNPYTDTTETDDSWLREIAGQPVTSSDKEGA